MPNVSLCVQENDVHYNPKPYDAEIEYLESTGKWIGDNVSEYIDTGIYGTMDLDFYIEFQPMKLVDGKNSGAGSVFGARADWNSNIYQLTTYNANNINYTASSRGHFVASADYGHQDNRVPYVNMFLGGKNIVKKRG